MNKGFMLPTMLLGMAIQAFIVGSLSGMGMLTVSSGQQLWAAMILLFMALLLAAISFLAERRK